MSRLLSGIFFHMSAAKDETKDYSRRMWLAVLLITAVVLSLVAALISMALVANSGVGVQVVLGTFILAFTILYASFLLKNRFIGCFLRKGMFEEIFQLLHSPAFSD